MDQEVRETQDDTALEWRMGADLDRWWMVGYSSLTESLPVVALARLVRPMRVIEITIASARGGRIMRAEHFFIAHELH